MTVNNVEFQIRLMQFNETFNCAVKKAYRLTAI